MKIVDVIISTNHALKNCGRHRWLRLRSWFGNVPIESIGMQSRHMCEVSHPSQREEQAKAMMLGRRRQSAVAAKDQV